MRHGLHVILAFAALPMLACGSSSSSKGTAAAEAEVANQAGEQTLLATNNASKIARQTSDDTQEQADMSETATSGSSDGGGTRPFQAQAAAGLILQAAPGVDFNAISADFRGSLSFRGAKEGSASLDGSCEADVTHSGSGSNGNLSLVLDMNVTRTFGNGDVIEVTTEPNLVVTKVGTRQAGQVTRTLTGTVHRALVSTKDPNRNFDLTISHDGTVVVDTYAAASFALEGRLINGTATVVDNLTHATSTVQHVNIKRGAPQTCLCPTGGQIVQTIEQNGVSQTHTYVFGGECGASTVSVDGSAAVAASGQAKAGTTAPGSTGASNTAHGEVAVHAKGSLSWDQCVPSN